MRRSVDVEELLDGPLDDGRAIVGNLRDLVPALRAIDSAGDSLVRGLGYAVTFPFAPETVTNACRGDYCNLDLVLDLTNGALVHGFTTKDGLPTVPGLPGLPAVSDLLGLLGLAPITGPLVGGLDTLLGVSSGTSPGGTAGGSGASPSGGTAGSTSHPLTNLLGGLLGGTRTTNGVPQ